MELVMVVLVNAEVEVGETFVVVLVVVDSVVVSSISLPKSFLIFLMISMFSAVF